MSRPEALHSYAAALLEKIPARFLDGKTDRTRGELESLFNRVANRDNWKLPIDQCISLTFEQADTLRAAIVFYTGSVPTFEVLVPAKINAGLTRYRVTSAGYYSACGA